MHQFKYAKLSNDPTKSEIKAEIKRLKELSAIHRAKDQGLKVMINSVYGVLGYQKFILYNRRVAESITTQSRDIIQFTIEKMNYYFKEMWHLDTDAHKILGISAPPKYTEDVINYADTDSVFLVISGVYKQSGYGGSFNQFAIDLDKHVLNDYILKIMDEYADNYNAHRTRRNNQTPSMNLELEEVCHNILWTAKKRYIKETCIAGKVEFGRLEKISVKGLEINKSSTPQWVRNKLKDAVDFILLNFDKSMDDKTMSDWVYANVQQAFMHTHIENICVTERIGKYSKFVLKDTDEYLIGPNCKPHVRGAGYHNHLIWNSELKNKYSFLGTGDRVLYYYTDGCTTSDVFSFMGGSYPEELAPDCDRDVQFEKVFLGPLNNILTAMDMQPLDHNMIVEESIF